MDIFIQKTEI